MLLEYSQYNTIFNTVQPLLPLVFKTHILMKPRNAFRSVLTPKT